MVGTIIGAIIAGVILGVLARVILPGKQNISIWLMILVGAVAALVGGLIADYLGVGVTSGIDWIKHAIQLVLAIIGIGIVAGTKGKARA
jgi:uncharacterized membrane protein YeaQ/YmgE (transglycosylase-associated protein family)